MTTTALILPPDVLEALARWHDARDDGCWHGCCCAHSEGQLCCIDELLGRTDFTSPSDRERLSK